MAPVQRCASHVARVAAGDCPVCARPRCGAEEVEYGARGCQVCVAAQVLARPARPQWLRLTLAVLTGAVVAVLGGVIGSEYVGAAGFELAAPALTGIAVGMTATSVARTRGRGPLDWPLRAVAAALAVLGTALSFVLVPGGDSPFTPLSVVGPPYLAAVSGALASRLLR